MHKATQVLAVVQPVMEIMQSRASFLGIVLISFTHLAAMGDDSSAFHVEKLEKLDSIISYQNDAPYHTIRYTYDSLGRCVSLEEASGDIKQSTRRNEYFYSNATSSQLLIAKYLSYSNGWNIDRDSTCTYDARDLPTTCVSRFTASKGAMYTSRRVTFTFNQEKKIVNQKTNHVWDSRLENTAFSYSADGLPSRELTSVSMGGISDSTLRDSIKIEYQHDSEAATITHFTMIQGIWLPSQLKIQKHDSATNTSIHTFYKLIWIDNIGHWQETAKHESKYDEFQNIVTQTNFAWQPSDSSWIPTTKTESNHVTGTRAEAVLHPLVKFSYPSNNQISSSTEFIWDPISNQWKKNTFSVWRYSKISQSNVARTASRNAHFASISQINQDKIRIISNTKRPITVELLSPNGRMISLHKPAMQVEVDVSGSAKITRLIRIRNDSVVVTRIMSGKP